MIYLLFCAVLLDTSNDYRLTDDWLLVLYKLLVMNAPRKSFVRSKQAIWPHFCMAQFVRYHWVLYLIDLDLVAISSLPYFWADSSSNFPLPVSHPYFLHYWSPNMSQVQIIGQILNLSWTAFPTHLRFVYHKWTQNTNQNVNACHIFICQMNWDSESLTCCGFMVLVETTTTFLNS